MLNKFDDYPIHQASVPIANSASGDVNQYDRYFFNGYSPDGSLYFAAAMGLYPKPFTDVMHSSVVELIRHAGISKL